jgi:hypothetical protein
MRVDNDVDMPHGDGFDQRDLIQLALLGWKTDIKGIREREQFIRL